MTAIGEDVAVVRGARLRGPGSGLVPFEGPADVLLADGRIADIAPAGALRASGPVLDGDGCWALPGLWDHHVHTVQWALDAEREPLDTARSAAEAASRMAGVPVLADGRRVGAGFRDALWPDAPVLGVLDASTGETPTYLISADVHTAWLNTAALRREGFDAPDGMLREEDAFEISRRLNAAGPAHADAAVLRAGAVAAARGVTGLVDFDMGWNAEAWPRRTAAGFAAHRVEAAIYPADLARAIAEGLRSGDPMPGTGGLCRVGPLKVISDGSLGTRTAACSAAYPGADGGHGVLTVPAAELEELLLRATGEGLAAAVHAIGDVAVSVALDAFARTGARGSIEHAQLVRHADLARFARLGVVASVQPQHAVDDRDLADRLWADQTALGYPLASLLRAGAEVRFGSDAPVAPLDPWQAIAAAVRRTADEREPWHPEERVDLDAALRASVRTELRPGQAADLVLCAADPYAADAETLRRMPVAATLLAGRVTALG